MPTASFRSTLSRSIALREQFQWLGGADTPEDRATRANAQHIYGLFQRCDIPLKAWQLALDVMALPGVPEVCTHCYAALLLLPRTESRVRSLGVTARAACVALVLVAALI